MEQLFLTMVQAISDNRFWVIPILAIGTLVMVVRELLDLFKSIQDEMRE